MISQSENQNPFISKANQVFSPHSFDLTVSSQSIDNLIMEGGEDFYNYVNQLGLAKANMIVLSSKHHYYYDAEEISKARTFVNLKELNYIKQIRSLFQSYVVSLPENSNFVGCFVNNRKYGRFALKISRKNTEAAGLDIVSENRFINLMYNLMDLRTYTFLTEKIVVDLLNEYNFEIMDMSEHNGRTYFHSQKISRMYN
jgi:hypothetical protein